MKGELIVLTLLVLALIGLAVQAIGRDEHGTHRVLGHDFGCEYSQLPEAFLRQSHENQ